MGGDGAHRRAVSMHSLTDGVNPRRGRPGGGVTGAHVRRTQEALRAAREARPAAAAGAGRGRAGRGCSRGRPGRWRATRSAPRRGAPSCARADRRRRLAEPQRQQRDGPAVGHRDRAAGAREMRRGRRVVQVVLDARPGCRSAARRSRMRVDLARGEDDAAASDRRAPRTPASAAAAGRPRSSASQPQTPGAAEDREHRRRAAAGSGRGSAARPRRARRTRRARARPAARAERRARRSHSSDSDAADRRAEQHRLAQDLPEPPRDGAAGRAAGPVARPQRLRVVARAGQRVQRVAGDDEVAQRPQHRAAAAAQRASRCASAPVAHATAR